MRITKLGHCCLVVDIDGFRILTDPGIFTAEKHQELRDIHAILFTHEHPDHYHLESLKRLLKENPSVKIIANTGVAALLSKQGIEHVVIRDGESLEEGGVSIEGSGSVHAPLHASLPIMQNTGFFIAERLWYPGDAFTDPKKPVEILALPVAGPWMKLPEALEYALALKPKIAFPVHDGLLNEVFLSYGSLYKVSASVLEARGTQFLPTELGKEYTF